MSKIGDFWNFRRNISKTVQYMAKVTSNHWLEIAEGLSIGTSFDDL